MAAPLSERERKVYLAKLCEQAERYDEMSIHMHEVAEMDEELNAEERNLLAVSYKNSVGSRRAAWRVVRIGGDLHGGERAVFRIGDLHGGERAGTRELLFEARRGVVSPRVCFI